MAKFVIEYDHTWEGTVEIEANSREEAKELFYDAAEEGELEDQYYPTEFSSGGYVITDIKEENES